MYLRKKTFRITAYDNQLLDGTYQADISLYRENDRERTTPVYQTNAEMIVSGFRGTIPDIIQWMGYFGNMQMVVALERNLQIFSLRKQRSISVQNVITMQRYGRNRPMSSGVRARQKKLQKNQQLVN